MRAEMPQEKSKTLRDSARSGHVRYPLEGREFRDHCLGFGEVGGFSSQVGFERVQELPGKSLLEPGL
jgi:hypothetical protein